jgi:hypothetical protein
MSYGMTEEQAMQVLMAGGLAAPVGLAAEDVPFPMGSDASLHPPGSPMSPYPVARSVGSEVQLTSGRQNGQALGYGPPFGQPTYAHNPAMGDSALQEATTGFGDVQTWLADDYIGGYDPRNPIHAYADQYYGNPGSQRGIYGDGRENRMSNKPEAAAAIRDQAGDLGAVIRTLMGLGRSGVAQNPPRPTPAPSIRGRSAQAPGQLKQAAGVQSARSFTPAATRAQNPPRPAAPTPAPAPRPSVPKPAPTPRPPVTRAPVPKPATTITRAKSR